VGDVVSRFRYGADAVCLAAGAAYGLNRWLVKPAFPGGFVHDHFNDLLLIPAALPLVLWIDRRLGWRRDDRMPTAGEVTLHVVVWSLVCEWIGPHFLHHGTGDFGDVCAYVAGAAVAWAWWNRVRFRKPGEEGSTYGGFYK